MASGQPLAAAPRLLIGGCMGHPLVLQEISRSRLTVHAGWRLWRMLRPAASGRCLALQRCSRPDALRSQQPADGDWVQPVASYRGLSAIEESGPWPAAVVRHLQACKCCCASHEIGRRRAHLAQTLEAIWPWRSLALTGGRCSNLAKRPPEQLVGKIRPPLPTRTLSHPQGRAGATRPG